MEGINFLESDVPDATTLLKFRHLLEGHGLGKLFFDTINRCLDRAGRMMRGGSIVDATLISAPSSTKNADKARDPEMHQTKKGNQWYFGMKCHTGVDAGNGFVHTVEATAANAHDVTVTAKLLREDDEVVYSDRPGSLPKVSDNAIDRERTIESRKSSVRCKGEHPYRIVKNIFGFRKTPTGGSRKT